MLIVQCIRYRGDICCSVVFGTLVGVLVFCCSPKRYINVCNCVVCIYVVDGMSVVSNECNDPTLCLVQPIGTHGGEVMYVGCVCFRGELDFLNCNNIVNKKFELLEFVFDSVYVDLQYDEISLTFTAGSVSLCCICSHVVVFGLSVRCHDTLCGCGSCCDCDA